MGHTYPKNRQEAPYGAFIKSSIDFFGFLHGRLAALVACELDPSVTSTERAFVPAPHPLTACQGPA